MSKAILKIEIEFDYEEILGRARVWEDIFGYKYNDEIDCLLAAYIIDDTIPIELYTIEDIELTKEQK